MCGDKEDGVGVCTEKKDGVGEKAGSRSRWRRRRRKGGVNRASESERKLRRGKQERRRRGKQEGGLSVHTVRIEISKAFIYEERMQKKNVE